MLGEAIRPRVSGLGGGNPLSASSPLQVLGAQLRQMHILGRPCYTSACYILIEWHGKNPVRMAIKLCEH